MDTNPALDRPSVSVSPPLVTPFDEDGEVDTDALSSLVGHCLDAGLDGLVPCGTTGEFASLTREEWASVVDTTVRAADGDVPVLAGVADTSVDGVGERLARAADAGADAGLVTMPYFHPANDPAGTEAFLRQVADDSPLPLVLYDIPVCTGDALDPETVRRLADHDRVVGLKDSSGSFSALTSLARDLPEDLTVLQGVDDQFVPGVAFGLDGGINALSQVVPEVYTAARDALATGDRSEARRLHEDAIAPLFEHCADHGFAPVTKTGLVARDRLPSDAVRPPLVGVSDEAREAIEASVAASLEAV